jgi:hypothetical protein
MQFDLPDVCRAANVDRFYCSDNPAGFDTSNVICIDVKTNHSLSGFGCAGGTGRAKSFG